MKSILDTQAIDVPCPSCGHKLRETIGRLKTNPKLSCSSCSAEINVDASELKREIAALEKQLAQLTGKFR